MMERIAVRSKTLNGTTKKKWMIFSLIAVVIVFSGVFYVYKTKQSVNKETVIQTSTIGTGNIILSATGLGTLIPGQEVSFGFKEEGQVSEVLATLGEKVEAGQVLARLDSKTLELQYKQAEGNVAVLSSPAEIASAEQAVQDAKASLATAKDDLQFLIGPDLFVAEQKLADTQQGLEAAKAAVAKDASDANKQKLSAAESELADAQKTVEYAFKNYSNSYTLQTFTYPIRNDKGVTKRRELIAPTDAELLAARAAYELAGTNLSDAQNYLDVLNGLKTIQDVPTSSVTSITAANLALDSAKAALDATELIAPISGTITSMDLSAGEDIGTSAIITISNMNQPYTLDASLDETDWDKAKIGYTATVTFDLLPDKNYSGKIIQVYPKLDDSSGTSMVHIVLQLDDTINVDLPVGSTASVDVTGGEALNVVLVPLSALKEVESGKYMVYLMKNGKPVEQQVEIGLQDILYAEVKSGLKRGDVVLTNATTVNQ
jgi:RND family efflux transporter, MFP subunit